MPRFFFTLRLSDHTVSEPFAHELSSRESARALALETAAMLMPEMDNIAGATSAIEIYDALGVLVDVIPLAVRLL